MRYFLRINHNLWEGYPFTSENALIKLIYSASQKVLEKWGQPMHNWALIISQLQIYFDGRLNLGLK